MNQNTSDFKYLPTGDFFFFFALTTSTCFAISPDKINRKPVAMVTFDSTLIVDTENDTSKMTADIHLFCLSSDLL